MAAAHWRRMSCQLTDKDTEENAISLRQRVALSPVHTSARYTKLARTPLSPPSAPLRPACVLTTGQDL